MSHQSNSSLTNSSTFLWLTRALKKLSCYFCFSRVEFSLFLSYFNNFEESFLCLFNFVQYNFYIEDCDLNSPVNLRKIIVDRSAFFLLWMLNDDLESVYVL